MNFSAVYPSFTANGSGLSAKVGASANLYKTENEPITIGTSNVNVGYSSAVSIGVVEGRGQADLNSNSIGAAVKGEASVLKGEVTIQVKVYDFELKIVPSVSIATAQYGRGAFIDMNTGKTKGASASEGLGWVGFGIDVSEK